MVGSQITLTSQTGDEGGGDIQYLHHAPALAAIGRTGYCLFFLGQTGR